MTALEQLLQKDCPFQPYQFMEAKMVLDWLWYNIPDSELQKLHMECIHERLDYYLFNYFYNKMGLKPISKCSIEELKLEIESRKPSH